MLGALIIMPLRLSVTADPMMSEMVFVVGGAQWVSLFGHVVGFGLTTGAVLLMLRGHAKQATAPRARRTPVTGPGRPLRVHAVRPFTDHPPSGR
ncbi:hypothetical protein LZG04_25730 [Saccharothrix sp. S26]|uniref:hypothetical protein n=1 Tax=Saccharothrix sp. S26 TaxID=2907215 RepID=UPI001F3DC3FD|nr:hypothetical protein [Saccharothrix sp. S26]MCE6998172.1 hypothetical protein [Saccharothrix sp. S26]